MFKPNVALPVGTLEKLEVRTLTFNRNQFFSMVRSPSNSFASVVQRVQFTVLAKIIVDYLTYDDVVVLRETCRFLHDFTRELRYSYQVILCYSSTRT